MGSWISSKKPDAVWIAVARPPGAGKTSLIRALLGDENTESPHGPGKKFTHPKYPNVTICEFHSDYPSGSELDPYDLLIIVSSLDTFASEYVKFAKEGQTMGKACYFVRTKIDTDVQRYPSTINTVRQLENIFQSITSSCYDFLAKEDLQSSLIFLVCSINTDIYQFPLLRVILEKKVNEMNKTRGMTEDTSGQYSSNKCSDADVVTGSGRLWRSLVWQIFLDQCTERAISANLKPEHYLKQVNGKNYAIFIIITSEIFKDHHGQLAKTLQDMGKNVWFVRTKIDSDLEAHKRHLKSEYNENRVTEAIRQLCVKSLEKGGTQKPEVNILSNLETEKFDFQSILSRIENHPEAINLNCCWKPHSARGRVCLKDAKAAGPFLLPVNRPPFKASLWSRHLVIVSTISFSVPFSPWCLCEKTRGDFSPTQVNACVHRGDVTINIGVTGEAGAGKSSLVNALRGLPDDQHGAAATGVTETTMRPARYPQSINNLQIWDLPGLGTLKFQLENYREKVGFSRYDFFIIVASGRFKENHTKLAKWINESGAGFYFVCTKIDRDIEATLKRRRTSFNQHQVLETIREDLLRDLGEHGVKSPQIFHVSACNFEDYDSKRLLETLEREVPKFRKRVFLRSIRTPSSTIIAGKKDFLSTEIWKLAFLSTVAAMAPVPGVGIMCDVGILLRNLPFYHQCFGLDEGARNRISAEIEKPVEELKAQIHSPQPTDINKPLFYKLLSNSSGMGLIVGEYILHGVPVIGSVLSGGIAFTMAKRMLTRFLQDLAADIERVLQWAVQSQIE
ncbi:LOW QUALITY PROTEIN: uncharacterized protein LOC121284321 [Carcharodon carcharias]|uniref:LOW QUALITY PROTEIN: uncharacterized protein LOC121284321 n=1 Tax=Carcharodon carcharias TaxID=13397 RepID=UPI001B7E720B|nr:LOW QUALITY PROTEIN: uncharacterized protein LOC121284321 [Carcharodon carcharias]